MSSWEFFHFPQVYDLIFLQETWWMGNNVMALLDYICFFINGPSGLKGWDCKGGLMSLIAVCSILICEQKKLIVEILIQMKFKY